MIDNRLIDGLLAAGSALITWAFFWQRSRALEDERDRYRAAFDLAPCPMWLRAPDGGIIALNKQFTAHFGLTMADHAGLTPKQQRALWAESEPVEFDDTDEQARQSDDVVLTVATLIAPRPSRSELHDPTRPIEYAIAKRRFPIRSVWGVSHGLIGAALSVESTLQLSAKARQRHEEFADKNPILHAINVLGDRMEKSTSEINGRIDRLASRVGDLDQDVAILFEGREDLRRTRQQQRDAAQFDGVIS